MTAGQGSASPLQALDREPGEHLICACMRTITDYQHAQTLEAKLAWMSRRAPDIGRDGRVFSDGLYDCLRLTNKGGLYRRPDGQWMTHAVVMVRAQAQLVFWAGC